MEIYYHTVLEAGRLRAKCHPGWPLLRAVGKNGSQTSTWLPMVAGSLDLSWLIDSSPSLCLHLHTAFSLCVSGSVSKFPFYQATGVLDRAHPNGLVLSWSTKTRCPNKVTFTSTEG